MNKAIYPGTFDPITRGHEDLVRRAARLFDQVVVAVAVSDSKKPFFMLEERVAMAQQVLSDCANVKVMSFSGLLMNFLRQQDARIILRGLRAASDFETLFMTPSEQYMFISATIVREIASLGGNADTFVHPLVAQKLREKIHNN